MAEDADDELDPADAFLVVAHEIRLGILRALWQAENHSLSFSALRKAVDIRDTGQFNYHLSKLDGRFVDHVDQRYELLYPGHRVVDAIQSGVFSQQVDDKTIALDTDCPECGHGLAFTYREFIARIECPDCGETVLGYPFDPGGFAGREDGAVPRAFDRRTRRYWLSATDGVCPVCAGPTDVSLVSDATTLQALERYEKHYASDQPVLLSTDCDHCSFYSYVPVGVVVLDHPGILGALSDRDIDTREHFLWEFPFVTSPDRIAVTATDPYEVDITVTPDGSELRATVDADGTITETTLDG